MRLFFIGILFGFGVSNAQEYLYPVASCNNNEQDLVYLMYQRSRTHIELWSWDPRTLQVQKTLSSLYTPAGLRILPDQSGFSFVDNDRIRIKEFVKRSPQSFDINEALYDIGVVEWIDGAHGYFSARKHDRFCVFLLDRMAESVFCMAQEERADCLYPTFIDNGLFYIERSCDNAEHRMRYCIMSTNIQGNAKTPVIDFGSKAIAFLVMKSAQSGYVLAHTNIIRNTATDLVVIYYKITKLGDVWTKEQLFEYVIPLSVLLPDSQSRLYESLLPLLPRHYQDGIYFVHANAHNGLDLYRYNTVSREIRAVIQMHEPGACCFVPLNIKNTLLSGGTLGINQPPKFFSNESGEICCELLKIT